MHRSGVNAILADEMGLGKTLQTIAFLAHLKFNLGVSGPHLVICPLSVLSSWMTEIKVRAHRALSLARAHFTHRRRRRAAAACPCRRAAVRIALLPAPRRRSHRACASLGARPSQRFCPALRAIKLHSSDQEERKRLMAALSSGGLDVDIVVTTYEMAKSPNVHTQLAARSWWRYLVVDEGHVLKNDGSLISQAVRRFHFAHALLLTGTPLQNNLHELWALLNFLYPVSTPGEAWAAHGTSAASATSRQRQQGSPPLPASAA